MKSRYPFQDPSVEEAFQAFPEEERKGLLILRELIFDCAAQIPETGGVQECLKWGQPSYLPRAKKVGTTIRLGQPKTGGFAIYTHCQTRVISDFQDQFPDEFVIEGNRAIHFNSNIIESAKLEFLIRNALSYHL